MLEYEFWWYQLQASKIYYNKSRVEGRASMADMVYIPRYRPRRTMGAQGQPDWGTIFFADIDFCGATGPLGCDMSCLVVTIKGNAAWATRYMNTKIWTSRSLKWFPRKTEVEQPSSSQLVYFPYMQFAWKYYKAWFQRLWLGSGLQFNVCTTEGFSCLV